MVDNETLGKIFNATTGVWTIACMAAVALFKAWPHIMGRANERQRDKAAEKDEDWKRVRAERDRYHELLVKCQQERTDWMHRAITAEAALQGMGDAKQMASRIVAVERLIDAQKKEPPEGK